MCHLSYKAFCLLVFHLLKAEGTQGLEKIGNLLKGTN